MAIDNAAYELMERYLSGDMNAEERERFERSLKEQPELMERFTAYQALQQEYAGMERSAAGETALSGTLSQMNRKFFFTQTEAPPVKKPAPVRRMIFALSAAASLLIAFFLLKPVLFGSGNKDLFAKYYQDESFASRGAGDSVARAADLYGRKLYDSTLVILKPYTAAHPDQTELLLYVGKCYLQTGEYTAADSTFLSVAGNGSAGQVYRDKAQWLRAMLLLKQDKQDECKKMLGQIPQTSFYYNQAKELLGEL